MAVIDQLVVLLGLDAKPFQKGVKDVDQSMDKTRKVAAKTGKDLQQAGKQGAEFFNQLQKSALKFFAVLTVGTGIVNFTKNVISTGAQLDRMSGRVDESVANLSRWQGAVRQSGGTAEGFLSTVQGISNQFTQLKETGDAPIRMLLTQLGVSAADATGKAKPILQLLRDIGDSLEGKQWANADKFNKLAAAGIDEGTINLLMRGRVEREKLLASQKAYSDAEAKAARRAEETWEATKQRIERSTQALVIKLLPQLEKFTNLMANFAEKVVPIMITGFEKLGNVLGTAYEVMQKIANISESIFGTKAPEGEKSPTAAQSDDLYKRAKEGDRAAAQELARQTLSAGTSRKPTQEMIDKWASQIMGSEGRRRAVGKVTDESGASSLTQGIGRNEAGRPVMSGVSAGGAGSSSSVSIGQVIVNTQATDAQGIARDLRGAIIRQADGGMR